VALQSIFDAIEERMGGVPIGGPDQVDHEGQPPRITWEPVRAQYGKARRLGGGAGNDGPFLTRQWTLRVVIWGESLLATERLVDQFLVTLQELLSLHSYSPTEETWNTGEQTDKGALCTMLLSIHAPVLRTVQPTRSITAVNATYTVAME
jgi:hypothetical protein